jgi:ferritin-like metal-binding protein YciE
MFEHFETPQQAYNYKLGVKALFIAHRRESEDHVRVVEEVFGSFGWEVDDSPCPAIEGLEKEGKANAKKTDDVLVDSILLQGALEVEHHEIGVYENLIINAEAMGRDDVVQSLQRNLGSEQSALEKVRTLQAEVAAITPKQPA